MAKFSENLSIAIILAVALLNTRVVISSPFIQTETENEVETDVISGNGDDADSAPPAAPSSATSEIDSNCDCDDEEALFHKLIRQLINTSVLKDKTEFLKQFPIKKVCGSDGKFYSTECELQCARAKTPGQEDLKRVNRGKCKKFGKGRFLKGKENSRRLHKEHEGRSHHPSQEKVEMERMQRLVDEPETLICICPRNYFPVCASNGVTYGNKCAFDCAKSNVNSELTVVSLGKRCNEEDKTII